MIFISIVHICIIWLTMASYLQKSMEELSGQMMQRVCNIMEQSSKLNTCSWYFTKTKYKWYAHLVVMSNRTKNIWKFYLEHCTRLIRPNRVRYMQQFVKKWLNSTTSFYQQLNLITVKPHLYVLFCSQVQSSG